MSIQDKQNAIIEEFKKYSSWEERYKHIIQLGKALPDIEDELKKEENRIKGCQSQVWLVANLDGDKITYRASSDAMIVRGLAALLISVFSGESPLDIAKSSTDFLTEIGLHSHLSQSRSNGLASMVKQFKNYAIAFSVLLQKQDS